MDNNKSYQQYIGTQYEIFVLNSIKHKYDNIFLWKDVPETYLKFLKLDNNHDIGADILAEKNMVIYLIQCKNYSKTIYLDDLAGIFAICHKCNCFGIIYYNGNMSEYVLNNFKNNRMRFNKLYFDNTKLSKQFANQIIPRGYQLEAYQKLKYKSDALLSLPCGMGKTYISTMLSKHYHNIIILSPLKCLANHLLDYFCNTIEEKYKPFLISSDGERNLSTIVDSLEKKNMFSATYDSCDVVAELIDKLDDVYIIIDECHNLSSNDIHDVKNPINKIINTDHHKLYMSATPKRDLLKISKNCIFKYNWDDAIKNKYICDFEIILPDNIDKLDTFVTMIQKNLSENVDTKIMKKILFGVKSILHYGSKKCILYTTTNKNAHIISDLIFSIAKLSQNIIDVFIVDYKTQKQSRDKIIYDFKRSTNIVIIISVHILDEGIDIPECDSVYITDPNDNIGTIVQRMCRANRITDTKKKSMIYMWCGPKKIKKVIEYLNENVENIIDNKVSYYSAINNNIKLDIESHENIISKVFHILPNKTVNDIGKKQHVNIDDPRIQDFNTSRDNPTRPNEKKIDRDLAQKLCLLNNDFILLLIEKYYQFKEEGLKASKNMIKFTNLYKNDRDIYKQFLDEKTETSKGNHIHTSTLYDEFVSWHKTNIPGTKPSSRKTFCEGLRSYHTIKKVRCGDKIGNGIENLSIIVEKNNLAMGDPFEV